MWCCNILWDNNGSSSHLLQLSPITPGSVLLTSNLVALKKENPEPILTDKIIEWRKFIDHYGLIIQSDQSRVGKKKLYFVCIGYIPSTSSVSSI